jgi:ParB-like chromosome segregation protein Spo0J
MARLITITKVSIDDIKEVPEYKELLPENNSYEEIKESIQQFGFLVPITVNNNYEILDGYTRYKIAKELGIKEIPVEIYETSGREEELDMIASFNLKRRHLSKDEIVALIDKIAEKKKALKTQITEKFKEQKNEIKDEQNATRGCSILSADTDKISTTQESREIKEELKRLAPNVQINEETIRQYLQIKKEVPWLVQYIGDKKNGKIGITKAYDIYRLLKEKNLLDLDKRLPKSELSSLITDKYGKKVLESDDLLQQILDHKIAVSQAINKLKMEKKASKSKKKSNAEEIEELEEEEDEEEEFESEVEENEDNENNEYDFVGEWQQAAKEEEQALQQNVKNEVKIVEIGADSVIQQANIIRAKMFETSLSKIKDKLSDKEIQRLMSVWENFTNAFVAVSNYFWFNAVPILRRYMTQEEIEELFYEFVKSNMKFYSWDEIHHGEIDYNIVLKKFNEEFYGEKGGEQ